MNKKMKNPALVVICYNRPNSISRLLQSLIQANYNGLEVPLIISVDSSGSDEVTVIAQSFSWPYGEKKVIQHSERLGLRKHVISCGNLSNQYDSIVLLEDDIYVSPYFYSYVCQTVEKYGFEDRIAGISLYTHLWNTNINRPYVPQNNGYDAYFLQYAQSWGQVWNKRMWNEFYTWYSKNDNEIVEEADLPERVIQWPKSSWLKYFIRYIVKTNRYFVYPYIALSTNFTDSGTHNSQSTTSYQVPLLWCPKNDFLLPDFSDMSLRYDVFFEKQGIGKILGLLDEELCVDLYESKGNRERKRYWLTTKKCGYKLIKSFALQLKPHELNIEANIEGCEIFLYDTSVKNDLIISDNNFDYKALLIRYDIRSISRQSLFHVLKFEIKQTVKKKISKSLKRFIYRMKK